MPLKPATCAGQCLLPCARGFDLLPQDIFQLLPQHCTAICYDFPGSSMATHCNQKLKIIDWVSVLYTSLGWVMNTSISGSPWPGGCRVLEHVPTSAMDFGGIVSFVRPRQCGARGR